MADDGMPPGATGGVFYQDLSPSPILARWGVTGFGFNPSGDVVHFGAPAIREVSQSVMKMTLISLARLLVLMGWLLAPMSLWAVEMKGLYQVSMPVADRSDAERKRAVAEGIQQVLVRVSGDSGVSAQDVMASAATSADRFVVQYGYETRSEANGAQGGIYLNVQYDSNGVNNLLLRNGLPLWSSNRPRILLWMAWEQGLDRELVNVRALPGQFQMLQAEGKRRGVSLKFPEFDADDQSLVSLGDIWGMFPEPVLAASARYETPVVVMAKVQESTSATQINAMLQLDGQPFWFEVARSDTASALKQLVDQVVDKVGSKYAVVSTAAGSEQVVLQVEGVNQVNDYAALTRYLDGLVGIRQYQLEAVKGAQARFLMALATDLSALEQTFRLDRKLELLEPPATPEPVLPVIPPVVPESTLDSPAPDSPDQPADAAPEVQIPTPPAGPTIIRYHWRG